MFYKICIFSFCVLLSSQISAQRSKSHFPKYRSHSTSSYATQQKIANEEKRKAEEAAAQQRRIEAEKQAKQAQALQKALEEQERLSFKIKTPKFAEQISQKAISISKTIPKTAALLAKEAYEMHKAVGGHPYSNKIYQGLLKTVLILDPSFGQLQNIPIETLFSSIFFPDDTLAAQIKALPTLPQNKKIDARADYEGKYAAVAYKNNLVQIFDLKNRAHTPVTVHFWENASAKSPVMLRFSLLNELLALVKDSTIFIYHLPSLFNTQITDYEPIQIQSTNVLKYAAFSELDYMLVTRDTKNQLQAWHLEMSTYANVICDKVKGNLSDKSWLQYIGSDDPTNKVMYIKTPDGRRRTPVSTCSPKHPQLLDME
jgi:hypothetical protein